MDFANVYREFNNGERDVTVLLHEINACAGTHTMRRFATKRKGEVKCKDSGLLFKKKKRIEEYAPIFFSICDKRNRNPVCSNLTKTKSVRSRSKRACKCMFVVDSWRLYIDGQFEKKVFHVLYRLWCIARF